jgi:proteasome-associated ATPase
MLHRSRARQASQELLESMIEAEQAGAQTIEEELEQIQQARQQSSEESRSQDVRLLTQIKKLKRALAVAQKNRAQLQELLEKFTAPPLHLATFLETVELAGTLAAVVSHEGTLRIVAFGHEVPESLAVGDEVLLGEELNVLVAKSPCAASQCGQTATFDRRLPDGRLVLTWREEEVLVNPAATLAGVDLSRGDPVRWNRSALLATEKVERASGDHLFLERTPDVRFEDIGGLDQQIERLQNVFLLSFEHPEVADRYGITNRGSALLKGPPGTGKTMLAKALANWLASLVPGGEARFIYIKPGEFGSVWYSQTEANIREVFRVAREFGKKHPRIPVVIFLDELDAMGAPRGESYHRVDDRAQLALAAEVDGLEERGNIFVIAATNRAEALDEAFIRSGRFGDDPIEVPRPNRVAARAILAKYFNHEYPYSANGGGPDAAREELLDAAVSRLYSSNGASDIATITFRDGTDRVIRAADVVNGASLAKIARDTRSRACLRETRSGEVGIRVSDLLESIADEVEAQASLLTPASCRRYIHDLRQDVDVVRVERARTESTVRQHRYFEVDRAEAAEEAA